MTFLLLYLLFLLIIRRSPRSTLFPDPPLFRSGGRDAGPRGGGYRDRESGGYRDRDAGGYPGRDSGGYRDGGRDAGRGGAGDRKSTRLHSNPADISSAGFFLKKNNIA